MKRLAAALFCLVAGAASAQGVRVQADEPRAYGYQVGDLVERHVVIQASPGWVLDAASLPQAGGRGRALELRAVQHTARAEGGGTRHDLRLQYQVFLAPAAVRTLETPTLKLRFQGAGRSEEARIEGVPVTVAPLVPAEVSPRRGLGELQPDAPVPQVPTAALRQRLGLLAVAALPLLALLGWLLIGPPWRAWRAQPFGRAWRQLRRLPAEPAAGDWQSACRTLHEALNRSAGEVLFERGVPAFVAARPAFAALHDDLQRFLRRSRAQFFGGAAREPGEAAWLVALARRCRDAERGMGR